MQVFLFQFEASLFPNQLLVKGFSKFTGRQISLSTAGVGLMLNVCPHPSPSKECALS